MSELHQALAVGDENLYFAGQVLGHNPTWEEAVIHYYHHTGPHYKVFDFTVSDEPQQLDTAA